jgi:hypothetical protein
MSSRSIRRAAERMQRKLQNSQNRALAQIEPSHESTAEPAHEISEARLAANRSNAQLSTGPISTQGKAKSSLNAVKTGLTGRTVLLPGDDAAAYETHVASFFARHQPVGDEERNLVQSLADTEWRLLRIPALEMGIYAIGRIEFANLFDNQDGAIRTALIEAHTYLAYQRQLNNLSIQESRLRRQREKDTAALRQLQSERHLRETARRAQTAKLHIATAQPEPANGFEFSTQRTPPLETTADSISTEPEGAYPAQNAA